MRRAHDGDIASVIPRRFFLLVGRVVFFVDDDEPESGQRREHRRPRPDDEIHITTTDPVPLIVTLAVGERAVLNCEAAAKSAAEERRDRRPPIVSTPRLPDDLTFERVSDTFERLGPAKPEPVPRGPDDMGDPKLN